MLNQKRKALLGVVFLLLASWTNNTKARKIYVKETVVAGGPGDFLEVRHVVLKGPNYDIGRKIAEIAKRNNVQIKPSGDRLRNKVQREYLEKNYPIHYQRMRGLANAYGLKIEDDAYDFCGIDQFPGILGCSAVFYPAPLARNGHHILSRNYDFPTGNAQGQRPKENEPAVMSRPYVFEVYPDQGYPSLYICAFELLGGALDGINSEGLTVALLADGESFEKPIMDRREHAIGFNGLLCMRYLLDNCGDVHEAKEAVLYLKHYHIYVPCHYIIADRSGQSFIFEFSRQHNTVHLIDGHGPQCITNHLISKYRTTQEVPEISDNMRYSFSRLEILREACKQGGKFSLDEIKTINAKVAAPPYASNDPVFTPNRTLWHSIYDLDERKLSAKFYLGEKPDPKDKKKVILKYSDYVDFQLAQD